MEMGSAMDASEANALCQAQSHASSAVPSVHSMDRLWMQMEEAVWLLAVVLENSWVEEGESGHLAYRDGVVVVPRAASDRREDRRDCAIRICRQSSLDDRNLPLFGGDGIQRDGEADFYPKEASWWILWWVEGHTNCALYNQNAICRE